ncbi:MAG: YHS domain protein [Flavobacteriaceae bacterium]|nr:YHS domain protein [Flavobacteriaceae bacterium]
MKLILIGILVLIVIVMIGGKVMGISPIALNVHKQVFQEKNFAISGYDPVEYHRSMSALKGKEAYSFDWQDATWLFSTQENLESFKNNPQEYAPQVGGYCTFAVSKGFTAPGNGEFWHIDNNNLYLFSNEAVKKDALENFDKIKTSAKKKWD